MATADAADGRKVPDAGGRADAAQPSPPSSDAGLVVAGVGASAGGLQALRAFLRALPQHERLAIVIVQHLDPTHKSHLSELLRAGTAWTVQDATDGQTLEAGHVYVSPPNTALGIQDGALVVRTRDEGELRLTVIDDFFTSLSEARGPAGMAVILSGTGSDGSNGMAEVKQAGGFTFAQDPETAEHPGMPQAAIDREVVDYTGAPAALAQEVVKLVDHPFITEGGPSPLEGDVTNLEKVKLLLRKSSGVDFDDYKASTFNRRLLRRMALRDLRDLASYVAVLQDDADELQALFQDVLLNVTGFFREPATFDVLAEDVFPALVQDPLGTIRVWVPGCSTGEEVYSIAMALLDVIGSSVGDRRIQIFGTDINERNIDLARRGIYSQAAAMQIPAPLRTRFMRPQGNSFQVSLEVRELCAFSVHNVYRDPPFSNIDLVSCRNLLIYLRRHPQDRALTAFHYALRPGGTLALGSSESPGNLKDFYTRVRPRASVYTKLTKTLPLAYTAFKEPGRGALHLPAKAPPVADLGRRQGFDRALLAHFVPPGVIVDKLGEVLEFIGRPRGFLEPNPGKASLNLYHLARPGLEMPVRAVMLEAQNAAEARRHQVRWSHGGEVRRLEIQVVPLHGLEQDEIYAVTFQDLPTAEGAAAQVIDASDDAALETELMMVRRQLETTVHQFDATTEELRASNEEAMSVNQELQSTNEELQTTTEELQSANEELSTVNTEMGKRNEELTRVNSDLANLLDSVRLPIIFLGPDRRVRRFTPAARTELGLRDEDLGRRIDDVEGIIGIPGLAVMVQDVVAAGTTAEHNVARGPEQSMLLRIQPYLTEGKRIEGTVLVAVDVTELRQVSDELRRANEDLEHFAAFVSHELRAPVRNAKLFLGMARQLRAGGDVAGGDAKLDVVDDSLVRMLRLIDALLRFSEVAERRAGGVAVSVARVVDACLDGLDPQERSRMSVVVDGTLPEVRADEALLEILVSNILANTLRYAGPRPNVAITGTPVDADTVEIMFADDGPGFGQDGMQHAFELFQHSADAPDESLGLGLAICRRIAESMGGRIKLTSSNAGTVIHLQLPLADGSALK